MTIGNYPYFYVEKQNGLKFLLGRKFTEYPCESDMPRENLTFYSRFNN